MEKNKPPFVISPVGEVLYNSINKVFEDVYKLKYGTVNSEAISLVGSIISAKTK